MFGCGTIVLILGGLVLLGSLLDHGMTEYSGFAILLIILGAFLMRYPNIKEKAKKSKMEKAQKERIAREQAQRKAEQEYKASPEYFRRLESVYGNLGIVKQALSSVSLTDTAYVRIEYNRILIHNRYPSKVRELRFKDFLFDEIDQKTATQLADYIGRKAFIKGYRTEDITSQEIGMGGPVAGIASYDGYQAPYFSGSSCYRGPVEYNGAKAINTAYISDEEKEKAQLRKMPHL